MGGGGGQSVFKEPKNKFATIIVVKYMHTRGMVKLEDRKEGSNLIMEVRE